MSAATLITEYSHLIHRSGDKLVQVFSCHSLLSGVDP